MSSLLPQPRLELASLTNELSQDRFLAPADALDLLASAQQDVELQVVNEADLPSEPVVEGVDVLKLTPLDAVAVGLQAVNRALAAIYGPSGEYRDRSGF